MPKPISRHNPYKACRQAIKAISPYKGKLLLGATLSALAISAYGNRDTSASMPASLTVIPERFFGTHPFSERGMNYNAFQTSFESGNLTQILANANFTHFAADFLDRDSGQNSLLTGISTVRDVFRSKIYGLGAKQGQPDITLQIFNSTVGKLIGTGCEDESKITNRWCFSLQNLNRSIDLKKQELIASEKQEVLKNNAGEENDKEVALVEEESSNLTVRKQAAKAAELVGGVAFSVFMLALTASAG